MLFIAFWKIPVERTEDAIYTYENVAKSKIPGLKVDSYLLADVKDRSWHGISLVEAESDIAVHDALSQFYKMMELEVKPAMKEDVALRFREKIYAPVKP